MYARITDCSSYLPKTILTNDDLSTMVDTSDDWILKRTGISQRFIAEPSETVLDLAEKAAAPLKDKPIDLLIVATYSAENRMPSLSSQLQKRLGLEDIPSFDLNAACSGFIYGVCTARGFIESGLYENIMIVGVDKNSNHIDWTDRNTCCIFGDGAGAVIVSKDNQHGIIDSYMGCKAEYAEDLFINKDAYGDEHIQMDGKKVFKLAVNQGQTLLKKAIAKLDDKNPDYLIFHQANKRIIDSIIDGFDIEVDTVSYAVKNHANTSAASIPLALHHAIKHNKIKHGDSVLLTAFGAGFSWGSVLLKY